MPTILIVDNDPHDLRDLEDVLEGEGYTVFKASSPREAQAVYDHHHPDLVVTDLRLTDDNNREDYTGYLFAKGIKDKTPVIIRSASQMFAADPEPNLHLRSKKGMKELVELVAQLLSSVKTS